jgi:predicted SAM-dependent methyltransferase
MKLNLGCGPGPVLAENYIHIDASRKLLLAKLPGINFVIKKVFGIENNWDPKVKFKNILGLRLNPDTVESIYSSHLLEHLYYSQCVDLLRIAHKSLITGGIIRLVLPDYDAFILRYIESYKTDPVLAINEFEESLLSYPMDKPSLRGKIWKNITGDLHIHRWHPTYASVHHLLIELGYRNIERYNYRESKLAEIDLLENRDSMSFYIEATK